MEYPKPFLSMTKEEQDQQIATWQTEIEQLRLLPETPETLVIISQTLVNIGRFYTLQDRYDKAEPLLLEALALSRKPNLPYRPNFAGHLEHISYMSSARQTIVDGKPVWSSNKLDDDKMLEIWRPQQSLMAIHELMYIQSVEEYRNAQPIDYDNLVLYLQMLTSIYRQQDRIFKADAILIEALAIQRKRLPINYFGLVNVLGHLAGHYKDSDRYAEAELLYLEASNICALEIEEDHEDIQWIKEDIQWIKTWTAVFYEDWAEYKKKSEENEVILPIR